jgi:hypothetical protein
VRLVDTVRHGTVIEYQLQRPTKIQKKQYSGSDTNNTADDYRATAIKSKYVTNLNVNRIVWVPYAEAPIDIMIMSLDDALEEIYDLMETERDGFSIIDEIDENGRKGSEFYDYGDRRYLATFMTMFVGHYDNITTKQLKKLTWGRVLTDPIAKIFPKTIIKDSNNNVSQIYESAYVTTIDRWNQYYPPGMTLKGDLFESIYVHSSKENILKAVHEGRAKIQILFV